MMRLSVVAFGLLLLPAAWFGQDKKGDDIPFTLKWRNGKCAGCRAAQRSGTSSVHQSHGFLDGWLRRFYWCGRLYRTP